MLAETVRQSGLDRAISAALAPWCKGRAVHDPGKALLDVTLAVAMGGDCLSDVAMLRAEPDVFGPASFDPTAFRLFTALAETGPKALTAIRSARSRVRERVWARPGRLARTPTDGWSGPWGVKSRSTRSGGLGADGSDTVVRLR